MLTTDRNITIVASADGSSQQSVTKDGNTTTTVSKIKGTKTTVKVNGDIETVAGKYDNQVGYFIKVQATLKADGTNEAKLIKVSQSDANDISDVTGVIHLPIEVELETFESTNGMLYLKATMSLNKKIVVE